MATSILWSLEAAGAPILPALRGEWGGETLDNVESSTTILNNQV